MRWEADNFTVTTGKQKSKMLVLNPKAYSLYWSFIIVHQIKPAMALVEVFWLTSILKIHSPLPHPIPGMCHIVVIFWATVLNLGYFFNIKGDSQYFKSLNDWIPCLICKNHSSYKEVKSNIGRRTNKDSEFLEINCTKTNNKWYFIYFYF